MDRPLFERMRRGRVGAMIYGIESGSQAVLRKMRKGYLIEDADHVLRYGAEAGIQNVINLIVGFPGETEQDHRDTMAFVERNREFIHHVGVLAMCMIYPHSPLAEQWEYFGLDPSSLEQFNPYSVNVDWRDLGGLDVGVRQRRFWELFRQIRGYGIGVTGVEDEEELTPELLGKLVESLRSPTAWVREDAIVRLAQAVEPSLIPVLEQAMGDESFLVAGQALLNLARIAPDRAWTAAAPLLRRKASYLDYAAALALSRRVDSPTMALLEDRLGREKFARHSSELKEALAPHREAYSVFERFQEAVARGDGTALEPVLAHPLAWVRTRSLEWLRRERPGELAAQRPGLVQALADAEADVVLLALQALRDGGFEAPRPALEPLMIHADPRVRAEAALLAGGAEANPGVVSLAGSVWPSDRSLPPGELEFRRLLAVRRAAVGPGPVGRSGLFCRALVEGSTAVRAAALEALLTWKDTGHAEEVLASLHHPEPSLRRRAIVYLGRTRDGAYELPLLPMLHDPDLFVAQEATASLARMQSVYLLRYVPELLKEERLRELPDFVREPMEPCGRLYRQAWELEEAARGGDTAAMEVAYRAASPMVRVFLLEVLRETGSALLHRGLVLAALADLEPEVRSQALELLEFVTDPTLCPVVQPLMEDPYHRCRAWACMYQARHRHAPARPVFLRLLHDSDDYVKEWAARGLGCLADPRDLIILADLLQDRNFATLPPGAREDLAQMYRMAHDGRNFGEDSANGVVPASTFP
jgi:HEAT repeat protein